MYRTFFFALVFLLNTATGIQAQNDGISRFFNQYADDERFTMVYISPKMFQLLAKIETDDEDWNTLRDVVRDLGGLRVLTSDSIDNGMELYKNALSKVPQSEYSELLTVRDGKENVRMWTRDSGNVIHELLLLVGSPNDFTMLSFTGKIDLDKISQLSKKLDIDGVQYLDKLKKEEKEDKEDKKDKKND